MSTVKILIVEGPAGSGKDTLINTFQEYALEEGIAPLVVPLPINFERPRAYTASEGLDDYGTAMGYAKDLARIAGLAGMMTTRPASDLTPVYILNRWLLSSLVYGRLRANIDQTTIERRERVSLLQSVSMIPRLINGYGLRYPASQSLAFSAMIYHIKFVINLPTVGAIEERRSKCERKFPYSAQDEFWGYREVLMNMLTIRNLEPEMLPVEAQESRLSFQVVSDHGWGSLVTPGLSVGDDVCNWVKS